MLQLVRGSLEYWTLEKYQLNRVLIHIIFLYLVSFNLLALCNFNLSSSSISETAGSLLVETSSPLSISRPTGTNASQCAYAYFFFSKGSASSYSRKAFNSLGESLDYNLYQGPGGFSILKSESDFSNVNEYIRIYLQHPKSTYTSQFYFRLPALSNVSLVRGGTYTDSISMSVYRGGISSSFAYYEFSRIIPITIFVPKIINISLVDPGSPIDLNSTFKTLNFGDLETNEELSFDLMIASNAGYRVSVSSLNNGKLKNTVNVNTINYSLFVSGAVVNLNGSSSTPVPVKTGSGVSGASGVRVPMKVKIGTVNDANWGDYTDYITVTAQTND